MIKHPLSKELPKGLTIKNKVYSTLFVIIVGIHPELMLS